MPNDFPCDILASMSNPRPDRPPAGIAARLALLVANAGYGMADYAEDGLGALGLDGREYMALAVLDDDRPSSQLELATLCGKAPAVIVDIVDGLESRGLVARSRDPEDRRRSIVTLTATGRAALKKADRLADQVEREILVGLDDDERRHLHELLQRAMTAAPAAQTA